MVPPINDGAASSLDRNIAVLRHIHKAGKKGLTVNQIRFFTKGVHGLSKRWLMDFLKEWKDFGVIEFKAARWCINPEGWELLLQMREDAESLV